MNIFSFTVKPSKPRCWMEGRLLEASDVKLSCKSSDGSDPIHYKWREFWIRARAWENCLPTHSSVSQTPQSLAKTRAYQNLFCCTVPCCWLSQIIISKDLIPWTSHTLANASSSFCTEVLIVADWTCALWIADVAWQTDDGIRRDLNSSIDISLYALGLCGIISVNAVRSKAQA